MRKIFLSVLILFFLLGDSLQAPVDTTRQVPHEEVQQVHSAQHMPTTGPRLMPTMEEAQRMPIWELLRYQKLMKLPKLKEFFEQHPSVINLKPGTMPDAKLAEELSKLYGKEPDGRQMLLTNLIKNFLREHRATEKLLKTVMGVRRRISNSRNMNRRLTKLKESKDPEDIAKLERIKTQRRISAVKSRVKRKEGNFIYFDQYMEMLKIPEELPALVLEKRARDTLRLGQDSKSASIMLRNHLKVRGYGEYDISEAMAARRTFLIDRWDVVDRDRKRPRSNHHSKAGASTSSSQDIPGASDDVYIPAPLSVAEYSPHATGDLPHATSSPPFAFETTSTQSH